MYFHRWMSFKSFKNVRFGYVGSMTDIHLYETDMFAESRKIQTGFLIWLS